jgi:hypothetical protein
MEVIDYRIALVAVIISGRQVYRHCPGSSLTKIVFQVPGIKRVYPNASFG